MIRTVPRRPGDRSGAPEPGAPERLLRGAVAAILAAAALLVLAVAWVSDPDRLGTWALIASLHAMLAYLWVFVTIVGLVLVWRLTRGTLDSVEDLQLVTAACATLCLLTLIFGNWLYGHHVSTRVGRLAAAPAAQRIVFDANQLRALFTLPLTVSVAVITWRHGAELERDGTLRTAVATLYVAGAAVLGAVVAYAAVFRTSFEP